MLVNFVQVSILLCLTILVSSNVGVFARHQDKSEIVTENKLEEKLENDGVTNTVINDILDNPEFNIGEVEDLDSVRVKVSYRKYDNEFQVVIPLDESIVKETGLDTVNNEQEFNGQFDTYEKRAMLDIL